VLLVYYHRLWCPVYCKEQFCRFALVGSIIQLPYLHDLFRLIFVQGHVCCLILPLFYYCYYYYWFNHTSQHISAVKPSPISNGRWV
jgi:hypothetical protein